MSSALQKPPLEILELVATVKALRAKGIVPVVMPSSPLMHTAGLANSLPFQMLGGRCVTLHNRSFDPLELWRAVARERVMCMIIVGDAFARPMLAALDDAKARRDARPLQPQGRDLVRRDLVAGRQGKDAQWLEYRRRRRHQRVARQPPRQTGPPPFFRWPRRDCSPRMAARSRRVRRSRA
jgi:acyl-CoA synthetase (AMP-forming)/AMP-acid ligase II